MATRNELVVVANRLPVHRVQHADSVRWETSPGGLVSALKSVLKGRGVTWVGWTGVEGPPPEPFEHGSIQHHPVGLSAAEVEHFYENFSNRTLWPLYHDAVRPPEFHRHWWHPYVSVNRRFAEACAEVLAPGGVAWVHDYQLQLVPRILRVLRPDARITFFLHIPFPPIELFAQVPWRRQILEGILGADLAGFQTKLGAQNFARLAERYTDAVNSGESLVHHNRRCSVEALPISIDTQRFQTLAETPSIQQHARDLRVQMGNRRILLGVDRLDYTKGIDNRLRAYETLLQSQPDLAESTAIVQVAVPSRRWVPEYEDMRERIEQLVGHINGAYGEPGRVPVHYLYRNLPVETLVSYYLAADVMVVTPLRDGMNLVAKEYVACRRQDDGVLVLSEFAGAAWELEDALQVNPHDVDGLASTFDRALRMPQRERARRMSSLRRVVEGHDVFHWAQQCLKLMN